MNLLLLDKDEKLIRFINNAIDPFHLEELNGENTLEFDIFVDTDPPKVYRNGAVSTVPVIEKDQRVLYKDIYNKWHEFIIRGIDTVHSEEGMFHTVFAEDSLSETMYDYITDKRNYNSTAVAAVENVVPATRFEVGVVDDLGIESTNFYHISAKEAFHKIADTWKAEIETEVKIVDNEISGRLVHFRAHRGTTKAVKRITYSRDMTSITRKVHTDDVITALYGYGKGEHIEETDGYGRRITFGEINDGKDYVENLDALAKWGRLDPDGTRKHKFHKVEFDDCEDQAELLQLTTDKLQELTEPKVTYTASILDLKALGYDFEGVELGDEVVVIDTEFVPELRMKARITSIERDLNYPYTRTKIVIGNFLPLITDRFASDEDFISNFRSKQGVWDRSDIIGQNGKIDAKFLDNVVSELNKIMNSQGGYVYLEEGKGIITYDKPVDQNPTMAIQMIGGGFRIANSKKPNGEWDWRTFGTGDGFTADEIIAGILKGGKIKLDLNNGTFLIGNSTTDYLIYFDGTKLHINLSGKSIEDRFDELESAIEDIELTPGPQTYVHIRYSELSNGGSMTPEPNEKTRYIGIYSGLSSLPPGSPMSYTWSSFKGVDGTTGEDGEDAYIWVKYADSPTTGMSDSPTGKKYIGMAFNKRTEQPSTNYSDYDWLLMPQNIVVGGRNLVLQSEVTTSFEDSINTINLSVPMLMDYIGSEMTLSFYIQSEDSTQTVKTYLMDYDDMTVVPNSMSEEFEVSTSPMRVSYTFTLDDISEIEHLVLAFEKSSSSGFVSRWKAQLEYGDTMQDWRPAFEDLQADIDGKASAESVNTLEGNLTDLSTIVATKEELGSIYSDLLDYSELLAKAEIDTNQAKEDISTLLQRVPVIENNLGEFVEKWSFIDSYITMGNEGLLIGAIDGSTMLRFAHDRIDFIDGDFDDPVAELTNQFLKINHGIFVVSAQIGEHRISTKTGGHTIVEWMGGGV